MIAQILIAIFGVTAVWLSQSGSDTQRKYSCLFGLAGQPAWFYATWTHEQWGMFALCFLYTACYLRGFRQYWLSAHHFSEMMRKHGHVNLAAPFNEPEVAKDRIPAFLRKQAE